MPASRHAKDHPLPPARTDPEAVSPVMAKQLLLAGALVVLFTGLFVATPWIVPRPLGLFTSDVYYMRALYRENILLIGGALVAWVAQPALARLLANRGPAGHRQHRAPIVAALVVLAAAMACLLVLLGRRQFGGWDFNIAIDVGWRQLLGQRPYVDFVTPTPPFFNWGSALAFRLFGVSWNANLYLAAIFSVATFLWAYFLLRGLTMSRLAALCTAALLQVVAMLSGDFWWYNNTTLTLAALFYLAAILLSRNGRSRLAQISFVVLLGLLPLTKPNIAGVTIAGCVGLLFASTRGYRRLVLLTLGGLCVAAFLFAALHVSIPALIATYRGIARERGGLSTFGFESMSWGERHITQIWIFLYCVPLLAVLRPLRKALARREWKNAAFWLFFPLSALVALYGIAGNGELRDVECTLLIVALGLLAFVFLPATPLLPRAVVALFCGLALSNLYIGIARVRVFTIGAHKFFEWQDNDVRFTSGFLAGLHASTTLQEVDGEVGQALRSSPGPVFFGPRLEFEYAVRGLPSPTHWTTFFQPGTSFARADTPRLIQGWEDHRFPTLILLKNEYTFYPPALLAQLRLHYIRDDHFPRVTVYRRLPDQ